MTQYIIRRLLQMIPILFGITFLTYALINAAGSPLRQVEFNPRASPQDVENIRRNLGLDRPWLERYFVWLGNVIQGDLGLSMIYYKPVTTMVLEALPYTIMLSLGSILLSFTIALPIGIYSAVRRNGVFDRVFSIFSVAGFAVPTVWLSLLLIILFSVKFREWGLPSLPVGGTFNLRGGGDLPDRLRHMILPMTALTLPQLAIWTRYIRSSMLEVIRQDYVRTAQSKGLGARSVTFVHALRNALLPLVTLVGLTLPEVFAGSLIVENVFAYRGMGRLIIDAVVDNDYTVIMGTTLFFAVLIVIGNLIADILYAVVDPRIRYG